MYMSFLLVVGGVGGGVTPGRQLPNIRPPFKTTSSNQQVILVNRGTFCSCLCGTYVDILNNISERLSGFVCGD